MGTAALNKAVFSHTVALYIYIELQNAQTKASYSWVDLADDKIPQQVMSYKFILC